MIDNSERTAVLLMAYGTPRHPDEILPYYTDIRRGRAPTEEQLGDLIRRYQAIGGISPLAQRTESQRDALQQALDVLAPEQYFVVLGLKHAHPMIEQSVDEIAALGFRAVIAVVLAPHFSSFSIGQYIGRATQAAQPYDIAVVGVQSWAVLPEFVDFLAADLRRKLVDMPTSTRVLFTAHSLPQRIIDTGDPYPNELRATATAIAQAIGLNDHQWQIAWQSAGRTPEPWIGPDILEAITTLSESGDTHGVVVCACGFVADHLEVLYDLDIEAAAHATKLGLQFARTECVNDDARVLGALAQVVHEAATGT